MTQLFDRVMMTVSGTPGTGAITLGSPVLDGSTGDRLSFAAAGVPNGAIISYVVVDGHNWGKGHGVYTSAGTSLSRDAAEVTWNGSTVGSTPISLSSAAVVMIDALAADISKGSLILLESHTVASGSPVSFVNFTARNVPGQAGLPFQSDFDDYVLRFMDAVPSVNNMGLCMRVSTNGGSTYDSTGGHYAWTAFYMVPGATGPNGNGSDTGLGLGPGMTTSQTMGQGGDYNIRNPLNSTLYKTFHGQGVGIDSLSGTRFATTLTSGGYLQTAAFNSFQVYMGTAPSNAATPNGTVSGIFRLYGIAK